jgi:hypothetical protein
MFTLRIAIANALTNYSNFNPDEMSPRSFQFPYLPSQGFQTLQGR